MTHIIYISIILILLWQLIRAYHLLNLKYKEIRRIKEATKIPYNIFSHYEKAYVNFYKWMIENDVDKKIVDKFDKLFNYDNNN